MSHHTSICPFGTTPDGEPVSVISLDNDKISCKVLTYGATLHSLCVPDRNGVPVDVVLGYDTLREYMESVDLQTALVVHALLSTEKSIHLPQMTVQTISMVDAWDFLTVFGLPFAARLILLPLH